MHGHCSRYPDDSRLAIPVFEIWISVVWANFFMKKIRWHSPERKKAKSPRYRTADALNPLSINMVDCCCACLLRIGCDAFYLIPRIWRRSTSIFDSYVNALGYVMCWTPKRSRITPPFTHTTLYTYMQLLVACGPMKHGRKVTSSVLHQLCFRRRSFSLWRPFCVVLSAMQWKESVFFCI